MIKNSFFTFFMFSVLPVTAFADNAPSSSVGGNMDVAGSPGHFGMSAFDLGHPATQSVSPASEASIMSMAEQKGAATTIGNLTLSDAFIKAMTPGQPVGGGYVTIVNHGSVDDTLVGVEAESRSDHVELHEMSMSGDVMTMRKLANGIALPAGQTVELKPGGLHIMFMGVEKPFTTGEKVRATFIFQHAGRVDVELPVLDFKSGMQHKM